ncbi:hypothetical protein [Prescottella equi]|uniref:hypothetical protein n=1 Tax=Rhodococcus hoagii TaxID=43767 RepID=UPI000A253B46|nr:hypothetical protein [Prescottella equi]ORJ95091.1 hypothetical protein A6F56_19405 [Prescottella equi]ORL06661.1 hypothetical protein A6I84_16855 [Prescottella equi]ORL73697.1 hypothetical protein A5N75_17455 [Prescottella equi]ORL88751.1 hypothetical protein A5N76_17190 [Prescottella equi]BDE58896.1 hypothetical protein REA19_19120 [Prescottella equi]
MGETTVSTRATARAGTAALCAGVILGATGCADSGRPAAGASPVACPTGTVEFVSARPGVAESMVPDTPLFAEVCRYEKAGGEAAPSSPRPASAGRLEGTELDALVDALNAAGPTDPRRCGVPAASDATTIVWTTFRYASGPPVQVRWSGPCNQSSNGTKLADGLAREIPPYWTNPVPLQVN